MRSYFMRINNGNIYVQVSRQAYTMTDKNNLLYLFDRPSEPIFMGKGDDNAIFDIPAEYLVSPMSLLYVC